MKKSNRILSFLLALVMVFTILPATVFAEGETDVLEGWRITLGDDIGVKFYLDSADYTVTATVNGEAVTPTISDNVATVNVAAAQMTDPIVLTVKDADQVVHTGKYFVRQYADAILNGRYDDKVKDMVKQMLNYGAASQNYFDHNTENLANSGITVPEITMPAENPQVSITDNLDGINFYGASLVMRNKTAVRFYFQVTGDINSFTFSQGTPVLKDDLYYIEIDGINPQNYADDITLTVNDGALSVTYSPLIYIARMYNDAKSSNEMKALVQAMYSYHLEAIEYQKYLETVHIDGHTWLDATCTEPKTCTACGVTEGKKLGHTDADNNLVCEVCTADMTIWNMKNPADAIEWSGYQSRNKNDSLTTTVTEAGLEVNYQSPGNGWKGLSLEETALKISKLTGKLTFTYSSDMAITRYRIHIATDLGGNLTANGTADCYTEVIIDDITAGSLEAWTQTTNEDGSVTVTFDLTTMGYFANGTELRGLTIVTVTANGVTGTVTYKSIELEKIPEENDCQVNGHIWQGANCTAPKTCYVCGETEGEALGHAWVDATCTEPKNCPVCYAIEGEALGHAWVEATCTAPKTCTACGVTEGKKLGHTDADEDLVCDVCKDDMVIWNMNNLADAADWVGYHAKEANKTLTTTVTSAGMAVEYHAPSNDWKGIVLEEAAINISKLTGKLIFTYSSDVAINSYRIHILTDLGGNLTANGTADCYTDVSIDDITAGSLEAWTQTTNEDGSVTVTFDLTTMGYFANGTELRGLTIVTVTSNKTPGTVTYKSIELEKNDCLVDGHTWLDATCTEPKTCDLCGATEGEALGHTFIEGVCSACGATEAALATPVVWDMSQQADASQWYSVQSFKDVSESVTYSQVSADGFTAYYGHKNAWKGIILNNVEIDITKLSGLLSFTYYTEDMAITNYRIHILTDLGGNLTANGTADCYTNVSIADITAGNLAAWTQTTNADGSVTVTFDLSTMSFFKEGTVLMGMDIVTVANSTTGEWRSITYRSIEIS